MPTRYLLILQAQTDAVASASTRKPHSPCACHLLFITAPVSTCRRCAEAAVPGCCTLLQRYKQPSLAPLPVADAVKLVARLVSTVRVQGMDYAGRLDCYKLLLTLLQVRNGHWSSSSLALDTHAGPDLWLHPCVVSMGCEHNNCKCH